MEEKPAAKSEEFTLFEKALVIGTIAGAYFLMKYISYANRPKPETNANSTAVEV